MVGSMAAGEARAVEVPVESLSGIGACLPSTGIPAKRVVTSMWAEGRRCLGHERIRGTPLHTTATFNYMLFVRAIGSTMMSCCAATRDTHG